MDVPANVPWWEFTPYEKESIAFQCNGPSRGKEETTKLYDYFFKDDIHMFSIL